MEPTTGFLEKSGAKTEKRGSFGDDQEET